jgi:hypothetical protein
MYSIEKRCFLQGEAARKYSLERQKGIFRGKPPSGLVATGVRDADVTQLGEAGGGVAGHADL